MVNVTYLCVGLRALHVGDDIRFGGHCALDLSGKCVVLSNSSASIVDAC